MQCIQRKEYQIFRFFCENCYSMDRETGQREFLKGERLTKVVRMVKVVREGKKHESRDDIEGRR